MKKWLAFLMVLMLAVCSVAALAEEEEEGDSLGTIVEIDSLELEQKLEESLSDLEPEIPEGLEKAVIGADNRVTVSDPSQYPYSAIALMDVEGECSCHWNGTGFMVGPDGVLLTAAHCVYCPEHSKQARKITFYFGYKSSKNYLYKYTGGWTGYVGNTFAGREYSIEKDYAVIKLDKSVVNNTGRFGARWGVGDVELQTTYVTVAGYRDGKLRYDTGYMDVYDNDHSVFLMDMVGGNSGGPIYDSNYYAIGIIIADGTDRYGTVNIGYRLTNEVGWDYDAVK